MSSSTQILNDAFRQQQEAFIERMLRSASGVFDIFSIYIGHKLGFYRTLAQYSGLTATELADYTGAHPRYVREWLEQQTVTGILELDPGRKAGSNELAYFRIPAGHVEALVETDSLNYITPLAQLQVGAVFPLTALLKAYRQGGGVAYADYGPDLIEGQAAMNRAMFLKLLGTEWLPAIADVHARLQANPPARVADIGCGAGWSSIGMAQSYPNITVDGFDLDEFSVKMARNNAFEAGLTKRINFQLRDAGDPALAGQYDLVTAFECLHDMSQPVATLRAMRRLAGENGAVIIVDERVGDSFSSNWGELDWMMYGWSILHCLPAGMAEQPSAQTGTVMRFDTLRGYALEAGFKQVEILPIENFFFRFYRLHA
jgi:2-polyprenyl-3-methyl-5-hydroxy-6-metoxy-1,4-benzoquinol methylase